ncbi:hypothetical protein [Streptomyces sp. NPDC005805]|uniref:hypothetical protein n=1 Tax=Streptomyces sp. NPDC005805 TaxID=3157068 RepID=UPI0033E101E2
MNRIRTAAVSAAVVAVTAASFTPASAAPAPRFLSPGQLPAASTPWTADSIRKGAPDERSWCTAKATPATGTRYRDFRTELDTTARQTITVASTEAKAAELAAKLRRAVETCLHRMKAQDPGLKGKTIHHGRIAVEEGANVYSIDTSHPKAGANDIALFSVGRDGRAVTVVEWGQMGDLSGVPLAGFRLTTSRAVAKLY